MMIRVREPPFYPRKRHVKTTISELSRIESQRIGPSQSH